MEESTDSQEPPVTPDRIRALRRRLGLSQVALAGWIGVARRTILDWEAAPGRPAAREPSGTAGRLLLLIEAYGLPRITLPSDDEMDEYGDRRRTRISAARARRIRASAGLSQEALSVILEISRWTVTSWESDEGRYPSPSAARLMVLIELHGIDWVRKPPIGLPPEITELGRQRLPDGADS